MKEIKKIPVVILNGFLGSGKTTLFRSLLAQANRKNISVCAIVNDMSELDVDGELIGNTDIVEGDNSKLESISSCVLSSKTGIQKLGKAVDTLLANKSPELIIIETSGSCHPMPLVQYFKKQKQLILNGVFVLVDSLMLKHDFNYGETLIPKMKQNMAEGKRDTINLLIEQIMFCSHVFITKTDRIENEKLPYISSYIQEINPLASTHSVNFGKLTIESLFELNEYNYSNVLQLSKEMEPILESEESTENPYDFATRVINDDRPFHPKRLWDVCHQYLDKQIYRSKGFFWLASRDKHSLLWQQAAGGISLELIGSWRSGIVEDENNGISKIEIEQLKEMLSQEAGRFGDRHCNLTVIGDKSQVNQFTARLNSCFLTEEEIRLWEEGYEFEDPWPKNIVKMIN